MIPYAITSGNITQFHTEIFKRVVSEVENLEDGLDCHEVCRLLAAIIKGIRVVHGKFNHYDHSWLEIENSRIIIDAYPWACGSGPFIIDCQTGSPWTVLYREHIENIKLVSDPCVITPRTDSCVITISDNV